MSKNKTTFRVSGMSCNGCSNSISKALSRMDGVKDAKADFQKGIAVVEYDEKIITKAKIIEVIENLDFKVEGEK